MKHKNCELCLMERKTHWFYYDAKWVICNCDHCGSPFAVYKKHTMFVPFLDFVELMNTVQFLFGIKVTLRMKQRKIHDHFHVHLINAKLKGEKDMLKSLGKNDEK